MTGTPQFRPAGRALGQDERAAAGDLLRRAFAGPDEAELVERLRRSGAIAAERVIGRAGAIVAYAALSRMAAPEGWLALAPVAVDPGWQRRGLGIGLVRALVREARAAGQTVVVLGDPAFYRRAGFSGWRAGALVSPFPISHTLIARPGRDRPRARLVYAAAFGGS